MFVTRKDNPLLEVVETSNFADLEKNHQNQKEKYETRKMLSLGVRNGW
jgi:hypothetical protein